MNAHVRKFVHYTVNTIGIAGLLTIITIGVILTIACPDGEVYFGHNSDAKNVDIVDELFHHAEVNVDSAFGAHYDLSKLISGNTAERLNSPKFIDGESRLRRIIKSLGIQISDKNTLPGMKGELDLVSLIELAYAQLGFVDYRLHVVSASDDNSCKSDSESSECLRLNVKFISSSPSGANLSQTLQGSSEDVGRDLATFVMRGIVRQSGDAWRRENANDLSAVPPYLFSDEVPNSLDRIEATVEGLTMLRDGCSTATTNCLLDAKKRLLDAVPSLTTETGRIPSTDNPAAMLGLALLDLHAAMENARLGHPAHAHEIELNLWDMDRFFSSAIDSHSLRKTIKNSGVPKFPHVFGDMEIERAILFESIGKHLVCALWAYRRAKWNVCLDRTRGISTLPIELQPYFHAVRYNARVHHAESRKSEALGIADSILQEIRTTMSGLTGNASSDVYIWPLRFVEFALVCNQTSPQQNIENDFGQALLRQPVSQTRQIIAIVEDFRCRKETISTHDIDDLLADMQLDEGSYEQAVFHYEVARHFARSGIHDEAMVHFEKASNVPWAFVAFTDHPDFSLLRDENRGSFSGTEKERLLEGPFVRTPCGERENL